MTQPLAGLKILAVDDEPMLLLALEDMLNDLGCQVVATATNLKDALAAAGRPDIDAAVLDVTLGKDMIDDVAVLLGQRKRAIVYASGQDQSDVKRRFGPHAVVIGKPYAPSTLHAALLQAVGRQ